MENAPFVSFMLGIIVDEKFQRWVVQTSRWDCTSHQDRKQVSQMWCEIRHVLHEQCRCFDGSFPARRAEIKHNFLLDGSHIRIILRSASTSHSSNYVVEGIRIYQGQIDPLATFPDLIRT